MISILDPCSLIINLSDFEQLGESILCFISRYFANAMMGCGVGVIRARAGLLKHVVKAKDILQMVKDSSNEKITNLLRLYFFGELKDLVSPRQMMETCDAAGVSRKGYEVRTRTKKKLGQEYYGVQSEKNIWWLAAFELPHETHDTLTWYFNQTSIPNIIS